MAVLLGLLLTACSPTTEPAGGTDGPHPVVIALPSPWAGPNELIAGGSREDQDIRDQLLLHLFEERPDFSTGPPSFAPDLAESVEWSADHRRATVRLRPDVRWSDGAPVTAEDVVWTWRAQTDPQVGWRYAQSKERIASVSARDRRTVVFAFDGVYPAQMSDLNEGAVLPRHVWGALPFDRWRDDPDWFSRHLVGDGPFRLAAWTPGESVVLAAAPDCRGEGCPSLERVVFRVVPEAAARIAQLEAGALDYVAGIEPADAVRLAGTPGIRIARFWHRRYDYLAWNLTREPFSDRELRRAMTLGIDRQALVDALWRGFARISTSPVPAHVWAANGSFEPWPYDPSAARARLAALGWEDRDGDGVRERSGRRLAFELAVNGGNRLRGDTAVMIQSQLAAIGAEVSVETLDFHALVDRLDAHDFDAALGAWNIDTSLDLWYAFHTDAITDGYNSGGYSDPEVDRLIEATRRAPDAAALRAPLLRIQEILHRDQPYTFLVEPFGLDAHRERLLGPEPSALGSFRNLSSWRLSGD
ncbi:MAG: ABC transporter substrate-binding protein [Thermoanaerobaculia bacterium]